MLLSQNYQVASYFFASTTIFTKSVGNGRKTVTDVSRKFAERLLTFFLIMSLTELVAVKFIYLCISAL